MSISPVLHESAATLLRAVLNGGAVSFPTQAMLGHNVPDPDKRMPGIAVAGEFYGDAALAELVATGFLTQSGELVAGARERVGHISVTTRCRR